MVKAEKSTMDVVTVIMNISTVDTFPVGVVLVNIHC